jgi:hypothetical protein
LWNFKDNKIEFVYSGEDDELYKQVRTITLKY